jgi:tetratricopeptide (TPR) repeat protein
MQNAVWLPLNNLMAICFWLVTLVATVNSQGGITIFGRVFLPDGQPANRARVRVEMANGFNREVISQDDGRYEIRSVQAGRYQLFATNPEAPEQFSERAESDSTRSYAGRLQVDLYLRLPVPPETRNFNPGVVDVTLTSVPQVARKAYEEGVKLQKGNQPDKALVQFNQAIDAYPAFFQALTERANLRLARNEYAPATTDFQRALELNAKYAPAWRGLGYCQLQQKQFNQAVANLERAYAAEPTVGLTLMLLGYANLSLNRYEPAKQCLEEALRLDAKGAARAYVYLAEVLAHENKFKEAADHVKTYLKQHANAPDARQLKELEAQWRERGQLNQK